MEDLYPTAREHIAIFDARPTIEPTSRNLRQLSVQVSAMAAAAQQLRAASALPFLLPRLSSPVLLSSSRAFALYSRQLSHPLLPSLSIAIPAITLNLPTLLGDLWDSVLRMAVPKKKTSHMKKRHRQMAGKALKDVTSLCKCPGCGEVKRMHRLCPHCMGSTLSLFLNTLRRCSYFVYRDNGGMG